MFFGHQYFVTQQHQEDENLKIISSVHVRYLLTLELPWGQNFSLQYQYNINQISDENKEKYQFGDNKLIQY